MWSTNLKAHSGPGVNCNERLSERHVLQNEDDIVALVDDVRSKMWEERYAGDD